MRFQAETRGWAASVVNQTQGHLLANDETEPFQEVHKERYHPIGERGDGDARIRHRRGAESIHGEHRAQRGIHGERQTGGVKKQDAIPFRSNPATQPML